MVSGKGGCWVGSWTWHQIFHASLCFSEGARQRPLTRDAGTCGAAEGQGTKHSSTGALPILLGPAERTTPAPRPTSLGLLLKGTQMFAQLTAAAGSKHQTSHLKISGPFLTPLTASLPKSLRTCFATECSRTRLAVAIRADIPVDLPRGKQTAGWLLTMSGPSRRLKGHKDSGVPGALSSVFQRTPAGKGQHPASPGRPQPHPSVSLPRDRDRSSPGAGRGETPGSPREGAARHSRSPAEGTGRGLGGRGVPGVPEESSGMEAKATPGMQRMMRGYPARTAAHGKGRAPGRVSPPSPVPSRPGRTYWLARNTNRSRRAPGPG